MDVGWILLLPIAITSKRVYMKCRKMQILLDYKCNNCYYVCVVAKNMHYYEPARVGERAGGWDGRENERKEEESSVGNVEVLERVTDCEGW